MGDAFETVVAENRRLRKELKELQGQIAAHRSSRWWRMHPRFAVGRLLGRTHAPSSPAGETPERTSSRVVRAARSWRLKIEHEERNAGCPADEIVLRSGLRLNIHPDSRYSFEEFCYRSPEQVDELDAFVAESADKRRLLDVGAKDGLFSLVFAAPDPTKEALAVDASPVAFARLLYNMHRNDGARIVAAECALSAEAGFLEMHYDWEHAVAGAGPPGARLLRVESRTGDSLCAAHSFAPDVIKIDVEGHEVQVVRGLRETIRRQSPLLFLEVHPLMISRDEQNGRVVELIDTLVELGYPTAEIRGRIAPTEELGNLREIERLILRPGANLEPRSPNARPEAASPVAG